MKRVALNQFKRIVSLALSICIVVLSLAGAIVVSAETQVNYSLPNTGLVANGDMESFDVGADAFGGGYSGTRSIVTTEAYTGTKSLKIGANDKDMSNLYGLLTEVTDPTKTYLFSAYIKLNNVTNNNGSGADVIVKFEKASGGYVPGNYYNNHKLVSGVTDGWVRVTSVFTGADAKDFNIQIYSTDAYIDDVSLVEITLPDTGLIAGGHMESTALGSTFSGTATGFVTNADAYTGANSLHFGATANPASAHSIYAGISSVTNPEKTYMFSAYIKVNSVKDNQGSGADIYAKFDTEDGKAVPGNYYNNHKLWSGTTNGEWVRVTSIFTGANVKYYALNLYSDDVYVDNISLTEIVLPDTGLIEGGHIENETIGATYGANQNAIIVKTDSCSGEKSVHVGGTGVLNSITKRFTTATEASKTYLFSANIKVNSVNSDGNPYDVWVQFFDAIGNNINNGDYMSQHKLYIGTTNGEWVRVSKYITGVEAYGIYFFACSNDTYLDDISLVEVEMPDTGLIVGGHMETTNVGEKFAGTTTGVVTNTDAYSGENSLYFGANDKPHNIYAGLSTITDPTKTYLFSAYIKVNSVNDNQGSGADIYAKFVKEDGTEVPGNFYNNHKLWSGTTNGEWVKVTAMFTGANVKWYNLVLYSNDAYVDDISLIELDLPNTGLVANGHFEMSKVGDTFGADFAGDNAVVDTEVYAGEKALKLGGEADYNVIHQDFTAVTDPAKTYMFSAWVKINNVAESTDIADMFIQLYKEDTSQYYDGKYYRQIPLYVGETNGEWVKVAYTFNGVAAKGFELHAHSSEAYIDDISVVALEDTAIVPDGSFENDSSYRDQRDYFSLDTTVAHTGTRSLKVTSKEVNPDVDDWRENDKVKYITVDPTKTYRLKVWAKADTNTDDGIAYIKYTQANDSKKYKYFPVTTEWAEYDMVISQLDLTDVSARVALSIGVTDENDGVTVWFDDLSVEEIPDLYTAVIPTISTGELGETFFVDDAAAQTYNIGLNIVNGESYNLVDATAKIDIYNYATEQYVSTQTVAIDELLAGETFTKTIKVYGATVFGTYRVAITLNNEDFTEIYDRYFTVAKKSYNQNDFLAINEHHIGDGGQDVHGLVQTAGFGWVSADVIWRQENSFTSGMNAYFERCQAENLKVRVNVGLGEFPADSNGNGYIDTLEEAAAFGDFCAEMAAEYKGKIDAYEIMGEYAYIMTEVLGRSQEDMINAGMYYSWIIKEAYNAIKAEDPDALVILGAMNCSYDYNVYMLNSMLENCVDWDTEVCEVYFDALGIHPYTNPANPIDGDSKRLGIQGTVEKYQAVLESWEIYDMPIWLSEVGFSTATESKLPNTVKEQAAYLMQLYLASIACDDVEFLSIYNLQSGYNYSNTDELAQYGITGYDKDHTLYTKPAYGVVQTMTNLLNGVTFVEKIKENNIHKYVFLNDEGKYVTAIWSAYNSDAFATVSAASNTSATLVDSWGNEKDIGGTVFAFDVSIVPVFVISDAPLGSVSASAAIIRPTPVFAGNYSNFLEFVENENYEYSINGRDYSVNARFENLKPNTVYTVFCRDVATGMAGNAKFRTAAFGDLNGSKSFDAGDLTMMRKLLFTENDPAGIDVDAKDVNDDGEVNILDMVCLKKLTLAAE